MHIHPGSQDKYTYLSGKTDGYQTNERHSGGKTHYELCQRLVGTGKYEEASFAIVLTARIEEFHTPETFHHIARWFEVGIRNWAHTDVLCGLVLGPFLKKSVVALEAFLPWRESQWKYQRRAVPVATIEILDSQPGAARLLAFVEPLMMDGEKVVRQGMGWFLRELWKREPKPVEAFLLKYKDTAPRLIFQYATEKMTPAAKARFRRSRSPECPTGAA